MLEVEDEFDCNDPCRFFFFSFLFGLIFDSTARCAATKRRNIWFRSNYFLQL